MLTSNAVRERIWAELRSVAKPDSRFHLNFAEFIPDFEDSERATDLLVADSAYRSSEFAFITPDNCLTDLRRRMIEDRKPFVISTYGIYRGFFFLEPGKVPVGAAMYASWLDGMEHFGRKVTLQEIANMGRFDLMVTGASAVSLNGVRFGKGHGFFDLEWGMFTEMDIVDESTPVLTLVHDVQVVDESLKQSETDILVDKIVTPNRIHAIENRGIRPSGVKWQLLETRQIDETPPLQELQNLRHLP